MLVLPYCERRHFRHQRTRLRLYAYKTTGTGIAMYDSDEATLVSVEDIPGTDQSAFRYTGIVIDTDGPLRKMAPRINQSGNMVLSILDQNIYLPERGYLQFFHPQL